MFVRLDGQGHPISGTNEYRKKMPKAGIWREIPTNYCCSSEDSIITFRDISANVKIVSIKTADGSINWSDGLDNGGFVSFVIANGYDQVFTVVLTTPTADIDVIATTVQGAGSIASVPTFISSGTNPASAVISTTATPGTQYLVTLQDD